MASDRKRMPDESLVFCGSDKNDLYRVACDNGLTVARFDSAAEGVRAAPEGAAAATGDPLCREMEDRLADFLVSVQARSEEHPSLDGAWLRAFDVERWEYWAANSDLHWGPWCVECGWTLGWVSTGLALRELGRNLWDLTSGTGIARHFETVRRECFGEER